MEFECRVQFKTKEARDNFHDWMLNAGEQEFWNDMELSGDMEMTDDNLSIEYENMEN
jgi:hypothetical protein